MSQRVVRANVASESDVAAVLDDIRASLDLPTSYPDDAVADIRQVDISSLPDHRDIEFVTIDPPGAQDLDQAMHLSREDGGYLVRYAISAVALFINPGGPLDQEVQRRGVTYYGPDGSIPLHPTELSAGAASLLAGQDCPAYLWYIHLNEDGSIRHAWVELAQVRSRAQLTYDEVQAAVDGTGEIDAPEDLITLLEEIGTKRIAQEVAREGISLDLPEQIVEKREDGYELTFRALTDVEEWNAQISLLTGMAAVSMMIEGGIGVLRTMPPAPESGYRRLRYAARALKIDWPKDMSYPDFVRSLDSTIASHAAFMNEAITLFRGASYTAFGVNGWRLEDEDNIEHAAIAAPYAHVTAPLRRLVDRYGLEICRCLCADEKVPGWVKDGLSKIRGIMAGATQQANAYERKAINALEGLILKGRVGEVFDGVVIDVSSGKHSKNTVESVGTRGDVMIANPAIEAIVHGEEIPLGEHVRVRLEQITEDGPEFVMEGNGG